MQMFRRKNKPIENRYAPRWKIDRFLGVYDKDRQTFLGRVQDLSVNGMCVASTEALPLDHHVRLVLEIMRDDGSAETFLLRCRTMWVKPCGNTGVNLIGIEFSGPSPAAAARIGELIREQAARQG